jgi:hypothetical protein
MKKLIPTTLIAGLLLSFFGCTQKQSDQLTQQQKEQIKKEVKVVLDSIFAKMVEHDGQGALQYYSPEIVNVVDTSIINYEAYKKRWLVPVKSEAITITPIRENYIVLSKDFVISDWIGNVEISWKSGNKTIFTPICYTNVFKKVDGQWKAIYEHPYGNGVTQAAEKK